MARYGGSVFGEIKGKVGDGVGVGGQGRGYLKEFKIPKNPKSKFQVLVRNYFTAASQEWNKLTDAERKTWNIAGASMSRPDKRKSFGGKHSMSGKALYQEINVNAKLIGLGQQKSYSGLGDIGDIGDATITFNPSKPEVIIDLSKQPATASYVVIEITPVLNAGVSFTKGKFKAVAYKQLSTTSQTIDLTSEYTERFGTIPASGNVKAQLKQIDTKGNARGIVDMNITFV